MLKITQTQRRYRLFDKKTVKRLVAVIKSLSTYTVEGPVKSKMMDIYYDSEKKILLENNLILRKRILGTKSEIKLKRSVVSPDFIYADTLRKHEREQMVPTKDPLSKHYFFLNNALNSMYTTALKFDPDKLFEQMKVALSVDIPRNIYKIFGPGGFKAEMNGEELKVTNYFTKRKNTTEFLQIKLISNETTLPYYEDFLARIEKYCKEIIPTTDSRYQIAVNITQPLPTKEELAKMKREKSQTEQIDGDF